MHPLVKSILVQVVITLIALRIVQALPASIKGPGL